MSSSSSRATGAGRSAMSESVGPHLAGADPDDLVDGYHPDLPVADLARPCGLGDRVDDPLDLGVFAEHLHLHLRHEVDLVLGAAVDLGVAALAPEPLHLGGREAVDAGVPIGTPASFFSTMSRRASR